MSLRSALGAVLIAAAAALSGCATVAHPTPTDPLEGWNRGVQGFNDSLDEAVLKPVATRYREFVPQPVRTGVTNFFSNLADAWSAVNQGLQGKPEPALSMTMRFVVNSTFGLAGILDPATEMRLERQSEDFGQTLGRWGLGPGPYIVWPLFGPSSVRDSAALPLDVAATSVSRIGLDGGNQFAASLLGVINVRANLLGATKLLEEIALDRYSFLRNAYLARRRNLVYDGDPPEEPEPPEPPEDGNAAPK